MQRRSQVGLALVEFEVIAATVPVQNRSESERRWPVSILTTRSSPNAGPVDPALVDRDAHRNSLYYLDPISAGVLRRQDRKL